MGIVARAESDLSPITAFLSGFGKVAWHRVFATNVHVGRVAACDSDKLRGRRRC